MGKRSKRRSSARPASRPSAPPVASQPIPAPIAKAAPEKAATTRMADLAAEYRYVYGDLKRIGILAASMFALLVALALMAQYVF